jgi:membrane protein DedA with SNARE-associated domain
MPTDLLAFLYHATTNPLVHSAAIVLGTFILEDATTVIASLQVADGLLPAWLALVSLYVGIGLGDLGLFGVGRIAARHSWARRYMALDHVGRIRNHLDDRLMGAVISTRFLPGARLPTYTACGFLGVSFARFALAVVIATILWTTALFFTLLWLGVTVLERLGPWRWAAALAVVAILLIGGRRARSAVACARSGG